MRGSAGLYMRGLISQRVVEQDRAPLVMEPRQKTGLPCWLPMCWTENFISPGSVSCLYCNGLHPPQGCQVKETNKCMKVLVSIFKYKIRGCGLGQRGVLWGKCPKGWGTPGKESWVKSLDCATSAPPSPPPVSGLSPPVPLGVAGRGFSGLSRSRSRSRGGGRLDGRQALCGRSSQPPARGHPLAPDTGRPT